MNLLSQRLPRFLLTAALLYVGWYFLYTHLLHNSSIGYAIDQALCHHITSASAAALRLIGHAAFAGGPQGTFLFLDGQHCVTVGWQCDGLPMMALFAGFILAYPGPWRAKLWFIPLGLLVIHAINVLRVAGLALNHKYWHGSVDFNHHYTFTIVVYSCIFLLWTVWVRRLAEPGAGGPPDASTPGPAPKPVASSSSSSSSVNAPA